jgi:hypothetical protein
MADAGFRRRDPVRRGARDGRCAGGEGRFGATKGSQQGIVGVELQNRLPRARVIYASATGLRT